MGQRGSRFSCWAMPDTGRSRLSAGAKMLLIPAIRSVRSLGAAAGPRWGDVARTPSCGFARSARFGGVPFFSNPVSTSVAGMVHSALSRSISSHVGGWGLGGLVALLAAGGPLNHH